MQEARPTVTMHDVAARAGVSVATVSRVVNDRYGVGRATTARVQAVIEELGYQSSLVARSLRSERTMVLAFVTLRFEPFSSEVLKGAAREVRGSGYDMVVYVSGETEDTLGWEQRHVASLSGTLADGCIVVTPWGETSSNRPVVAIDPVRGSKLHTITGENLKGSQAAVEHLIELGHRRIGFLAGPADLGAAWAREEGYRAALERAGLPFDPALIGRGDFHAETAVDPTRALLNRDDPPTALFVANDSMALEVMEVAKQLGRRIPQDLSVVGFDNILESAVADPPLTTVDQHLFEMGREAARLLIRLLDTPDEAPQQVALPTQLVVRASTAAPPADAAGGS